MRWFSICVITLLLVVACTQPDPTPVPTPTLTSAPAPTPTPSLTPTPTPTLAPTATPPLPIKEWSLEGIQVDGSTVTVSLRLFVGISVWVTLDGKRSDEVGTIYFPIIEYVFQDVSPGKHAVEVRDVVGHRETAEVVVTSPAAAPTPTPSLTPTPTPTLAPTATPPLPIKEWSLE
ncbi:MAG: hypothetical protein HY666_01600, partial [Chloroflexi bacterium]|nr:hypothetical protein [Chloroflexota bacterium]